MPKMKTRKSVAGKFKVTATGKLRRYKCGRRKLMSGKSSKKKRHLRKSAFVPDGLVKTYKKLMCCQ